MRDQNLYELLQVSENADQEIIQAAYRRLVLRYHPDRSSEPNAAEMTQRLNDAYAILSDPVQRAEYDRERRGSTGRPSSGTGRSRPNPPPPPPPRPPPPRPPRAGAAAGGNGPFSGNAKWRVFALVGFVAVMVVLGVVITNSGGGEANETASGVSRQATYQVPTAPSTEVAPAATLAWREYAYTSEGERIRVVPPPTVPPSEQGPPQGVSELGKFRKISGRQIKVESVGFFDLGESRYGTGYGGEVAQDTFAKLDVTHAYQTSFYGSTSRFIGWELRFSIDKDQLKNGPVIDYVIVWKLYRDNMLVQEGEREAYMPSSWRASWVQSGMGSEIPGQFFVPGDYRVDFFLEAFRIDGDFIASGRFEVQ